MAQKWKKLIFSFCRLNLIALTSQAYHAITVHYDRESRIELTVVATDFKLQSPHAYIFLGVENNEGEIKQWEIEGGSAAHMQRAGVSNQSLKVADTIIGKQLKVLYI